MAFTKGDRANFATLKRAADHGDLALMECLDKETGNKVAVVCAASLDKENMWTFTPLAVLINTNPYERYEPPTLDENGGE
jgi:hypothetical protein